MHASRFSGLELIIVRVVRALTLSSGRQADRSVVCFRYRARRARRQPEIACPGTCPWARAAGVGADTRQKPRERRPAGVVRNLKLYFSKGSQ